jgi:hypothetical protein
MHSIWHAVTGAMMSWYEAKMFVERAVVFSSDALHVMVGMVVWLLFALILRRPVTDWRPWLGLLVLLLLNETVDLWVEQWPDLGMQYGESAKDVLLTMTLPSVLMAVARLRPQLFGCSGIRRSRRGSGAPPR